MVVTVKLYGEPGVLSDIKIAERIKMTKERMHKRIIQGRPGGKGQKEDEEKDGYSTIERSQKTRLNAEGPSRSGVVKEPRTLHGPQR